MRRIIQPPAAEHFEGEYAPAGDATLVLRIGEIALRLRGLPSVLSQTFRTLVHSRLAAGLASYEPRYPGQDLVLIEPPRDDRRRQQRE